MILENTHNVATNLQGSKEFSVSDDSSKIFAFLSNFLYRDKERSVITEISSNALDAHKLLGKEDLPISVTLPTSLVPMFMVRDFGPGLSEDNVYLFLTKYGSSSKGGTNDFIGGFGIGSKSPAAVSDTWNIKSYHDGVQSEYLIHINDKGIPNINKLYSKPTSETGLEVAIPTKGITAWHDAARAAYAHYEVMPQIKGAGSTNFTNVKFETNFHNLVKFPDDATVKYSSDNAFILMNRRSYSIDVSKISGIGDIFNVYYEWYLPFDTSSLSVSLSREDLQYDSRTIEKISERIKDLKLKFKEEWKNVVSCANSVYEYQCAANEFKNKYKLSSNFCRDIAHANLDKFFSNVGYNNLQRFGVTLDSDDLNINFVTSDFVKALKCGRSGVGKAGVSYSKIDYDNDIKKLWFNLSEKDDIVFVLRDVANAPSRVKYAISLGEISSGIILDKQWFDLVPDAFTKIFASNLKKVVLPRIKRDKVASEVFIKNGRSLSRWVIPDANERVYIKIKNAKTLESIINDFDNLFVSAFADTLTPTDIVFIKEGTVVPTGCVTSKEWVEKKYVELISKRDDILDAVTLKYYKNLTDCRIISRIIKSPEKFKSFDSNTVIAKILDEYEILKSKKIDLQLINLCDTMNECERLLGKNSTKIVTPDVFVELELAYPMLKFISNGYGITDIDEIVEYMRMCDK